MTEIFEMDGVTYHPAPEKLARRFRSLPYGLGGFGYIWPTCGYGMAMFESLIGQHIYLGIYHSPSGDEHTMVSPEWGKDGRINLNARFVLRW